MPLDFPQTPAFGDIFGQWRWDGNKWTPAPVTGGDAPADGGIYGRFNNTWQRAVARAGDTMTGLLTLSGAPTNPLHAATKTYVDTAIGTAVSGGPFLPIAGGSLTGPLLLAGPPSAPLEAVTKAYADTKLSAIVTNIAAGTGLVASPSPIVNGVGTMSLQVPVSQANGGTGVSSAAAAPWVQKSGDTMVGELVLQPASGYASLRITAPAGAGVGSQIVGTRAGSTRWLLRAPDDTAETGGNAGSDFTAIRFNDAGAAPVEALRISRATGNATFAGTVSASNFQVVNGAASDAGAFGFPGGANGPQMVAWGNSAVGAGNIEFYTHGGSNLVIRGDAGRITTPFWIDASAGITSADASVRLGPGRTADGNAYLDLFAQGGASNSARMLRDPGANGNLYFWNNGSGSIILRTAGIYNAQVVSAGDTTFYGRICVGTGIPGGLIGSLGALNSATQYLNGVLIHGSPRAIDASLAAGEPLPFTGLDPAPGENETCFSLMCNRGGKISLQKVVLGPVGSGGPGLRALAVSDKAAGLTGRPAPQGWGVPAPVRRRR